MVTRTETVREDRTYQIVCGDSIFGPCALHWRKGVRGNWFDFNERKTPRDLIFFLHGSDPDTLVGPRKSMVPLPADLGKTMAEVRVSAQEVEWKPQTRRWWPYQSVGTLTVKVDVAKKVQYEDDNAPYHVSLDCEQGMWNVGEGFATFEQAKTYADDYMGDLSTGDVGSGVLEVWPFEGVKNSFYQVGFGDSRDYDDAEEMAIWAEN